MRNIFYILLVLLFASCANENKFIRFHTKHDQKAAGHCATWYPVKETTNTITEYKPGETVYIPGETEMVTVDCDSVVQHELDEMARHHKPLKDDRVSIKVKVRVDTFFSTREHVVESVATKIFLQDSLRFMHQQQNKLEDKFVNARHYRNIFGLSLLALLVIFIIRIYLKIQKSYLKI